MVAKPDDDLFIEPANDDGVVYGDYNSTMDGASSSGPRPYIRLTSQLRNATRNAGGEVRFRCEAIGTQPIKFTWLKNHAPVEKSRRVRVRQKENSSRLVLTELDVLDSGYYQCIASNVAATVNTTSILRVRNDADSALKHRKKAKPHTLDDYEDYELMDRGRLPDEEDADLFRVPDTAGGIGYAPAGTTERWLDGVKYNVGDCVLYRGEACRQFLSGRSIMLTSESREDMYDIDRNLRAAMMFINSSPSISRECRQISQAVACYHMYKICDGTTPGKQPLTICKKDCERIQSEVCPTELALAAQHDLVGEGPKALFPSCPALPTGTHCIPILDVGKQQMTTSSETPRGHFTHWCYVENGSKYEGAISTTVTGKSCIEWTESTSRDFNVNRYPQLRNSRNFCRNPGGKKTKPWCYSQPLGQEEYCDVPVCPEQMYPHLREKPSDSANSDSVSALWNSLSSQWQMALIGGGVVFFLFLLLLLCCACCCRTKKKKQKHQQTNQLISSAPSLINSAANSAYYRKLNGTSTPIMNRGGVPMEMTSLLTGNQLGVPPPYAAEQYNSNMPQEEPYHILEIPASQLKMCDLIGEGQFGVVHTGLWSGGLLSGEPLQVAIKSVRPDSTNAERASLEEEVRTVASFDHPHVVRLLGVCYLDGGRLSAVFEYMVHGDLHDFLRLRAPSSREDLSRISSDNDDFLRISTQIAYGMEYLASMAYIHRDLATRNCLVGDNRIIKIADFGLMRACYDNDYYKMLHRSWMPVRWMSKEALEQGRFSEASDVWSFGITLWEVWSYGRQPYEGATNQQVIELIATRHLLECPPGCPTNIYSLMVECWQEHSERRPSFSEIHSRLQSWNMISPAHSILNPARNSNSSQSGSSQSGRGKQHIGPGANRGAYPARSGRRNEDVSPLMKRDANYDYSEDGDSD